MGVSFWWSSLLLLITMLTFRLFLIPIFWDLALKLVLWRYTVFTYTCNTYEITIMCQESVRTAVYWVAICVFFSTFKYQTYNTKIQSVEELETTRIPGKENHRICWFWKDPQNKTIKFQIALQQWEMDWVNDWTTVYDRYGRIFRHLWEQGWFC